MKKLLFISLIAVAVMESCSHGIQSMPEHECTERQITASLGFATKATLSDADAFELDFVRMDNASTTTNYKFTTVGTGSRAASSESGKIAFTGQYYNKNNAHSYFRCFNRLTSGVKVDNQAKTMTWTLDGKSDLLASDVWYAGNYAAPSSSAVTFKHLLSKIEVKCQSQSGGLLSVVRKLWGDIKSISVSINQKAVYNYDTNTFSYTTPVSQPLFAGVSDNTLTLASILDFGSSDVTASVMLPPTTSETLSLSVTTVLLGVKKIDVKLSGGVVAGKVHSITLYFPSSILPLTKTINDQEQYTYTCLSRDW